LRDPIFSELDVRGSEIGDELAVLENADVHFDELPSGTKGLL